MPSNFLLLFLLGLGAASLVQGKHVGCFYEASGAGFRVGYRRPGMGQFWPEDIDPTLCDVIYYGNGNILNNTYEMCIWEPVFDLGPGDKGDSTVPYCDNSVEPGQGGEHDGIRRTLALKEKNPDLKILYGVGGWAAGGQIFSEMVKTEENRNKFVNSATKFLKHFGFDGLEIDWEYPALDLWTGQPTDPQDKQRLTLLTKALKSVFTNEGLLLTLKISPDPKKSDNAYELDKLPEFVDWFNIHSFDYSGLWDGFTMIDEPLYGKWEESFPDHDHHLFNVHETVQYYLQGGVSPDKLVLGIHAEGKSYILTDASKEAPGVYCPAIGGPKLPFSGEEGWATYYEVQQLFNNETIDYPGWAGLQPGIDHWTIHDHDHGNVDMCYLSPYAYQGEYWISYEDTGSVDVKARYANHYGLKGAFIFTIQSDDFIGQFGSEKFGLLSAMNKALDSGAGLAEGEVHGAASQNKNCAPDYPTCRMRLTNSGGIIVRPHILTALLALVLSILL